ncbi:MAG: tetratricopeptide repeat protein [Proteobacteria bacterium]|nr:tetratricopeptide repeat protein [Pseudomonadota bacterium]
METTSDPASGTDQAGFQVDDLTIDLGRQRVTRAGTEIALPPLSFELLLALARAAPNVVTFDELTERVWPGLVISPETISQRVKLVRTALGDDPHAPRYIGGVRGRGYRMVATVRPLTERRRVIESVTPEWLRKATEGTPAPPPPPPAPPVPADGGPPATPGLMGWVGAAAIVLLLLALPWGATHLWRRTPPAASDASVVVQPPHTIAVLPLVDVTPGDGNSYLGEGLAQELSARLARIHGLRVASRTSAFAFRGRETDVRTIGQTLGVRHVLEGSVMRTGNQLRVTAQLVDAASGFNVWSQTYNRTWEDLVAIQDDVARSIVGTLQVVLAGELDPHPPTTRVDAFDLYLSGIAQLSAPGHTGLEQAGDSFRRALALDPKFALAYAGLCERYTIGYESTRDAALIPQAESACDAALKLDPSLREVSAALAHLYVVSGRSAAAVALYQEAIRADPENADGYMGLGEALEGEHQAAEAERAYRRAVDAEPTYPGAQTALGSFLLRHGRAAAAVPLYRRATELTPASPTPYNNLGAALEMTADFTGAAAAFERSLALAPTRSAYSNLGTVYYFLGRYPDAVRMFGRATELASEDHRVWGNLADARWQMGADHGAAQDDYRHAIALARRSLEVNPRDGIGWMQLAYYSARAGDAKAVPGYESRALELDAEDELVHYYAALIALERGNADAALTSLRRAVELGYPPQLVRAAPDFAALRADARFRLLVEGREHSPPA